MQQQCRAGDEGRAHGRRAGRVAALTKAVGQFGFLGQKPSQQRSGQHSQCQQRHRRPAAAQRRQVSGVKIQRFGQKIGQRRREHDPARKACAGRQQPFCRRAEYRQRPAQSRGQPGNRGKYNR